jgi:hypothetical protein
VGDRDVLSRRAIACARIAAAVLVRSMTARPIALRHAVASSSDSPSRM